MTAMTTTTTATTPVDDSSEEVRLMDLAERLLWTFVAAFTSALVTPPVAQAAGVDLSLSALEAAFLAGTSAVIGFVTVIARWRLSILPDPGSGLRRN
jgi:hypothetical protein